MSEKRLSLENAKEFDRQDPLRGFRDQFHFPTTKGESEIYFVGNSLGLQPKRTAEYVAHELEQWRTLGVRGHFEGEFPWMPYHEFLTDTMADLVGANADEVVMMNSLTVNLHLMMATFYRPTDRRNKVLIESHAFPSDHYAVESQIKLHGYSTTETLIEVTPAIGEETIRTERICESIEKHKDELALVMLPGVQYYTGQFFDLKTVTDAAHDYGILVGFDLAHAVGNVPLKLHQWDVDFAVWCSYKYLNAGPGSVGGCFVHRRHAEDTKLDRMAGWWGHDKTTRFKMENRFLPMPTAEGWQLSNPPILSLAAIRASLDVFKEAGGIAPLRQKSEQLTAFFLGSLQQTLGDRVHSITPANPKARGCQLSLEIRLDGVDGKSIYENLESMGVRTDWREPNVVRAAPVPLYNSFADVWKFVERLEECLS